MTTQREKEPGPRLLHRQLHHHICDEPSLCVSAQWNCCGCNVAGRVTSIWRRPAANEKWCFILELQDKTLPRIKPIFLNAQRFNDTTNNVKLSGTIEGRGFGCSFVAGGVSPNDAVTR